MATNDFLPFAGAAGSNVLTQAAYAALAARTAGFSAGVAKSAELNKVWRQSSIMSAALAQMISDNTGADVIDDGSTATILANLKNAVGGRLLNFQIFKTAGTYTYTPTPGTKSVIVEVIGGGGSGAGCAATAANQASGGTGGSGGGYSKKRITSGFSGATITVGAGGVKPASGGVGNDGGTSSFGAFCSATGGKGGSNFLATSFTYITFVGTNAPGAGFGGDINSNGTWAQFTYLINQNSTAQAIGSSGASFFGGGVRVQPDTAVIDGTVPGEGGSGSARSQSQGSLSGGKGADGAVVVWEYA